MGGEAMKLSILKRTTRQTGELTGESCFQAIGYISGETVEQLVSRCLYRLVSDYSLKDDKGKIRWGMVKLEPDCGAFGGDAIEIRLERE
jgi:hypothetical protein